MHDSGFEKSERDEIVTAFHESNKKTSWPVFDTLSDEECEAEYQRQDELMAEYAERLPFVPVSRCPFTATELAYPMDPFGFDGMWWEPKEIEEYPKPDGGPHFRALLGAVDFNGREPAEAAVRKTTLPGPGAPFVVPDLLAIPGMNAVISQLSLPHGDTAYLIAYFSEEPVHGAYLHQPWGRDSYGIFDVDGNYEGWGYSTALWDFDLQPWIDKGLVLWIRPGDESLTLVDSGPCPFVGLTGARYPQVLDRGVVTEGALPDGGRPDPLD